MQAITPLPYQEEGIKLIEKCNGRVLLSDEMGLGKTLQVLWSLQRNRDWLPALIVVPAIAKYDWARAAESCGFRVSICEGQTPPVFNRRDLSGVPPITIINFDILKHWEPYLSKLKFKTIVIDECQNLQNLRAQRTKVTKRLAKSCSHAMALSGTPLTKRPADMFPALSIIWPEDFNSFWSYAQEFCDPKWKPWGWEYKGASNLDKLNSELRRLGMIRRLKADVLKDLPPKNRRTKVVPLTDVDEYRRASTDFLGWIKANHAHRLRAAARAEGLTKIGYLLRLAARLKMRAVVDWANEFLDTTDEKLILFTVHRKAVDVLKRRVKAKSVIIDGSVVGRQRDLAKEQFQRDPKTRLLIGNLLSCGVALTLTASSTIGVTEFWWRPGDHVQAEDRIYRIGQQKTSWIWYLVAAGTIEERLCAILQDRQRIISTVLDGGPMPGDMNIYEELLDEIAKEAA